MTIRDFGGRFDRDQYFWICTDDGRILINAYTLFYLEESLVDAEIYKVSADDAKHPEFWVKSKWGEIGDDPEDDRATLMCNTCYFRCCDQRNCPCCNCSASHPRYEPVKNSQKEGDV